MEFGIKRDNLTINLVKNNGDISVSIIDNKTQQKYENTILKEHKHLCMDIDGFYIFMCNCFSKKDGYDVKFDINASVGIMRLFFSDCLDDAVKITHTLNMYEIKKSTNLSTCENELRLKINKLEKQLNDTNLKINELEEQLDDSDLEEQLDESKLKINKLEEQLNDLKSETVTICYKSTVQPYDYLQVDKYTEKLDLSNYNNNREIFWSNIYKFPKLTELIINNSPIFGDNNITIMYQLMPYDFIVRRLPYIQQDSGYYNIMLHFPQIKKLEIVNKSQLLTNELGHLYNMPNLEELRLTNFTNKIKVFDYIKPLTKLTKLIITNCQNIVDIGVLFGYCGTKNIELHVLEI